MCVCHILVITFLIVVLRLDFAIPNHCLTYNEKMGHKTKSKKKEKKNAVYLCLILITNGYPDTHGNFACMILVNLILTVND